MIALDNASTTKNDQDARAVTVRGEHTEKEVKYRDKSFFGHHDNRLIAPGVRTRGKQVFKKAKIEVTPKVKIGHE
ncbi:hypothetical protein [Actinomadura sp. 3N508]|uniref:hypothetical protein n=1 Tax=Actinomadura sp. 3N508 TaxID=3375153 RepID=UPI00379C1FB3